MNDRSSPELQAGGSYASLAAFIDGYVLPLMKQHPDWMRLDGWTSGGNREVAGRFSHAGSVWKVHSDSHFDRFLRAHEAMQMAPDEDPLVVVSTAAGNRRLELRAEHRPMTWRFSYLYIYEDQ